MVVVSDFLENFVVRSSVSLAESLLLAFEDLSSLPILQYRKKKLVDHTNTHTHRLFLFKGEVRTINDRNIIM